ncbi:uncharacterized protein si:dkey-65b12.12 [Pseudorasbora parva]|uniref:uncharacterized protein si:dkey-65b12.12 n=1 Tax=Pseudorasbora parva TaxID=51549 RepID=UPI00351F1434
MKPFEQCFSAVWMLCCCFLVRVKGHDVCQEKLISRVSLSTELQSEILLPCQFKADLFGSILTTNSSALWTQPNTTVDYIVELKIDGHPMFWDNRRGRINIFRHHSGSGNFSIMISNVQRSDLGLYLCKLYRDNNCLLAYSEINLTLVEFSPLNNWKLIVAAGGGGGGFLLLCLIAVCVHYTRTKRQTVDASAEHRSHKSYDSGGETVDEVTYASIAHKSQKCLDCKEETFDEITYASVAHKSRNCQNSEVLVNNRSINVSASEQVSSETVLYATVKQRDKTRSK